MKLATLCGAVGAVGSFFACLLGGWDSSLQTLLIFIAIDYITGLVVAGVFHNSQKTTTGTLESRAGFKGLLRKCMILVCVLIAYRLDITLGIDYCRNLVIIGFITNESISILENAGLMGLPIPKALTNAIDILKKKGDAAHE